MEEERKKLIDEEIIDEKIEEDRESPIHRIAYKIVYPLMILVALGVTVAGLILDNYFDTSLSKLGIPSYVEGNDANLTYVAYRAAVHSDSIALRDGDLGTATLVELYSDKSGAILWDPDYAAFEEEIVGMNYISTGWHLVVGMAYGVMGLLGLALAIQLIFRAFPSTMAFKVGAHLRTTWKNALPVLLIFLAALVSLLRLLLLTSFSQSQTTRLTLYAIKVGLGVADWRAFLNAVANAPNRAYQLQVLLALGTNFEQEGAKWGLSTWSSLACAGVCLSMMVMVFYMDTRVMRLRLKLDAHQLAAKAAIRAEMRRLPTLCKIRSIWFSLASFGLSVLVSKISGRFVYNAGKEINRRPFLTPRDSTPKFLVDDLITARTEGFWFNPQAIVDGAVLVWVPLVVFLIIGAVNRKDSVSKLIEQLAYGYWIRAVSLVCTVYPAPASVLQMPYCYTETLYTWWDMMMTNDFCNDMIYSGHATLALTPAFILCFMLVYGPYEHKKMTIAVLMLCVLISCAAVILGRFHYSADVFLSMIVCFLLALIHAPAWKVIFHYRRFELKVGSVSGVERAIGQLEGVGEYTYAIAKTRRIDNSLTDWKSMETRSETIRTYLDKLQARATDASN